MADFKLTDFKLLRHLEASCLFLGVKAARVLAAAQRMFPEINQSECHLGSQRSKLIKKKKERCSGMQKSGENFSYCGSVQQEDKLISETEIITNLSGQ